MSEPTPPSISPRDSHNQKLDANVHPQDWKNPTPAVAAVGEAAGFGVNVPSGVTADFQARIVIQNALFMGRSKASDLIIPWATYTAAPV